MTLSPSERRLISRLRTPAQVQRWLREIDYNHEDGTMRSFRGVYKHKAAHCLEGALAAAFILEHHGYPPLLLDLESLDELDHVVFLYQAKNGKWGAVGKSRYPGLMGRKPVYANVRTLAWSYVDPFIDATGAVTGWATYDLREHKGGPDWRYDPGNVWRIERTLMRLPHAKMRASRARFRTWKKRYLAWKKDHPDAEPPRSFYPDGDRMT